MKKISLGIIPLLFLILSCKKDSVEQNYFQFKIGDASFVFDSTYAFADSTSFAYFTSILAKDTKTNAFLNINTQSVPGNSINGTYTFTPGSQSSSSYNALNFNLTITSGPLKGSYAASAPFSLTIDKSGNNSLQGIFSGSLDPPLNSNSGTPLEVGRISGQFKIPYSFVP
jgi:hypothetical protein